MTESEFWSYVSGLGARLYESETMNAVLTVARWIAAGEQVRREELPWPLT